MLTFEFGDVVVSSQFLSSLTQLPREYQADAKAFVVKFKQSKIIDATDIEEVKQTENLFVYAYKMNHTFNVILFKPIHANLVFVMWVDHHEAALEWAMKHDASIHPQTGSIQVFDASHAETIKPQMPIIGSDTVRAYVHQEQVQQEKVHQEHIHQEQAHQEHAHQEKTIEREENKVVCEESTVGYEQKMVDHEEEKPSQQSVTLFHDYTDQQLSALGVPSIYLAKIMALVDITELTQLKSVLPIEAYEALSLLANGSEYQTLLETYNDALNETVDVNDYITALTRVSSQRHFTLITNDQDLEDMLNAPLEKWRVFLHPSQKKLVELEAKGPIRVLGGAGTGKTVVAMHRAVYLAKKLINSGNTEKRILLTTFTSILAKDIRNNLKKIASPDELNMIEVKNIDAWVSQLLKTQNYDYRLVYEDDPEREACWKKAMTHIPSELCFAESFYQEEWRHIILQQGIREKSEYLKAPRNGRGTALDRMEKVKVWNVFEIYRDLLNQKNMREMNDAFHDLLTLLETQELRLPYSSIIVDEAQDIGAAGFILMRKLIPEQANDLFIVGDGHQRIYRNKVVLGRCGISIKGKRSKKLTLNYRTTEEIHQFASSLLDHVKVDDLDAGQDNANEYMSLISGNKPNINTFTSFEEEISYISTTINALREQNIPLSDICVVVKNRALRDKYIAALNIKDIQTFPLSNEVADENQHGVRVSTIYRVKGLEFGFVFLAAVNEEYYSLDDNLTNDPVEKRDREFNQRALLHVAATRAIRELYVSCFGELSRLISS